MQTITIDMDFTGTEQEATEAAAQFDVTVDKFVDTACCTTGYFTGTRDNLKKMVVHFWGEDTLADLEFEGIL